jgi:beta-glucosidase
LQPSHSDKPSKSPLHFPEGFLWGAATSHFQVEGHPKEINNSLSDWSTWTKEEGRIVDKSSADDACQFYYRFEDDLQLVKDLNLNAFRLSFNWPALLAANPSGALSQVSLDQGEVDYYKRILSGLKESGIKTFGTLFHFCLPGELALAGGWLSPETADHFAKFSELLARELDPYVDYWITINEPLAYAYQGYVGGQWPPGVKHDYLSAFRAIRGLLLGHGKAYDAIKSVNAGAPVSFTCHWRPFMPKNKLSPLDRMVRFYRDYVFNHLFPLSVETGNMDFPFPLKMSGDVKRICGEVPGLKGKMDYLAINYYTRELSQFKPGFPIDIFGENSVEFELPINEMGWEIFPKGLHDLLVGDSRRYQFDSSGKQRDVIITENGYAAMFPPHLSEGDWSLLDHKRVDYLLTHLAELHRAIAEGVNVKGYLHWSLIDNFEWAEGLSARFGLVRVSYPTQERLMRESAKIYREIARTNSVSL